MSRLPAIDPRDLRDHADPDRIERVWRRVARDLPEGGVNVRPVRATGAGARLGSRAILWAACLAGVFGAGLFVGSAQLSTSTSDDTGAERLDAQLTDVFAAGTRQRTFALPGGGRLVLQPESLMEVVEVRDGSVRLHLLRGRAAVDASTSDLSFAIVAGEAMTLAPAGSVVSFSRLDTDVDVAVDRGSVEVVSPTGRQVVRKGERSRVPIVAAVTTNDTQTPPHQVVANTPPHNGDHNEPDRAAKDPSTTPPDGEAAVIAPAPAPEPPSWMVLYTQDKLDEAFRNLEARGGIASAITSSQSASEIMALGDVAQANKKFDLWVQSRRRVADEFPSDPNASIAAFELVPVLERMGQTEQAAKYRALSQQSRLAESALCKQLVNAPKDTAEDRRKAAAIATDYLTRFPEGTCAEDAKGVIEDSKADPAPNPDPKKADLKKDEPKKAEDAKKAEDGKKADDPKKDAPEGSSPP